MLRLSLDTLEAVIVFRSGTVVGLKAEGVPSTPDELASRAGAQLEARAAVGRVEGAEVRPGAEAVAEELGVDDAGVQRVGRGARGVEAGGELGGGEGAWQDYQRSLRDVIDGLSA